MKYASTGGKYKLGTSTWYGGGTVYDVLCHYCEQAEEKEKRRIAFQNETALNDQKARAAKAEHERKEQAALAEHERKEQAAQAEHERKEQAAQAEHERKERAAQVEHERKEQAAQAEHERKEQAEQAKCDRQVLLQGMAKERLERAIVLQEKKAIAAKEAHEHKILFQANQHSHELKIRENKLQFKTLEKEAEEKKRKDELSRIQSEYRGKYELENAQIEKLRLEIELLKMKIAQVDETAATDKPTEGDDAAERKEFTASLVKKKSCKAKARKAIRGMCSLRA